MPLELFPLNGTISDGQGRGIASCTINYTTSVKLAELPLKVLLLIRQRSTARWGIVIHTTTDSAVLLSSVLLVTITDSGTTVTIVKDTACRAHRQRYRLPPGIHRQYTMIVVNTTAGVGWERALRVSIANSHSFYRDSL